MEWLPDEWTQKVIDILEKLGVNQLCSSCGKGRWTVVAGYINHPITPSPTVIVLNGKVIPTINMICRNCGYLRHHALNLLIEQGLEVSDANEGADKKVQENSS